MKNLQTYDSYLNEGKEEWDDVDLSPEGIVELRLELEYENEGPFAVSLVDDMRKSYTELTDEEDNRGAVALKLGIKTTASDEEIVAALKKQYPQGYILHDNNDFHQWGGELESEDQDLDGEED